MPLGLPEAGKAGNPDETAPTFFSRGPDPLRRSFSEASRSVGADEAGPRGVREVIWETRNPVDKTAGGR